MHNYVLSAITGDKFRLNPFQTSDTYSLFQPIHRSRITLWSPREQSQSERSRCNMLCDLEQMEKNTAGLSVISKHSRLNFDRLELESEQISTELLNIIITCLLPRLLKERAGI